MNIPLNKLLIFQTEQVSAKGKGGGGVGTAPPEMSMTEVPHMPEEEVKLGTWTVTYPNGDKTSVVLNCFYVTEYEGELEASEESLELRFFSLEELPEPMNPHHTEYLWDYRSSLSGKIELPLLD